MSRIRNAVSSLFIGSVLLATTAHADLVNRWSVGTGDALASIQFDFSDGDTYVFDVSFVDDGSFSGQDAIELLGSSSEFSFEYDLINYTFGDFLVGVGIEDSYEFGDGSEPPYVNYWHYWTRESSSIDWESSMIGFGSRILSDGAEDAWVFGSNATPSVVPLPGTLALFAGGLMLRRRRCRAFTTDQR